MIDKMYGKIKWFNKANGYGYITGYDELDYFFSIDKSIENTNYKENDNVLFVPIFEKNVYLALNVNKIKRN